MPGGLALWGGHALFLAQPFRLCIASACWVAPAAAPRATTGPSGRAAVKLVGLAAVPGPEVWECQRGTSSGAGAPGAGDIAAPPPSLQGASGSRPSRPRPVAVVLSLVDRSFGLNSFAEATGQPVADVWRLSSISSSLTRSKRLKGRVSLTAGRHSLPSAPQPLLALGWPRPGLAYPAQRLFTVQRPTMHSSMMRLALAAAVLFLMAGGGRPRPPCRHGGLAWAERAPRLPPQQPASVAAAAAAASDTPAPLCPATARRRRRRR